MLNLRLLLLCATLSTTIHAAPVLRDVIVKLDGVVTQSVNAPEFPVGADWHGIVHWTIPDELFKARSFTGAANELFNCFLWPEGPICLAGYTPGPFTVPDHAFYEINVHEGTVGLTMQAVTNRQGCDVCDHFTYFFSSAGFHVALWFPPSDGTSSPDVSWSGEVTNVQLIFAPEPCTWLLVGLVITAMGWRRSRAI